MARSGKPSEFDLLATDRHFVQEFVVDHERSIQAFRDDTTGWFRHHLGEGDLADSEKPIRHITTVHTCWESLLEDRNRVQSDHLAEKRYEERLNELVKFAKLALQHPGYWRSEEAGFIYCRTRTLGVITRYAQEAALAYPDATKLLLSQIWTSQPTGKLLGAYGAREIVDDPADAQTPPTAAAYPTNAYHTYWATTALRRAPDGCYPAERERHLAAGSHRLRLIASEQMALLAAESTFADPQQLAWAITGIVYHAQGTDLVQGAQTYPNRQAGLEEVLRPAGQPGRVGARSPSVQLLQRIRQCLLLHLRDPWGNARCRDRSHRRRAGTVREHAASVCQAPRQVAQERQGDCAPNE